MKALVTGGGGFLGGAIVRQLVARGDSVRSFSRGEYPELKELGVETLQGDLADGETVCDAIAGCDVVFHAGARAGVWGRYIDYYQPNVVGTQNVVEGCRRHKVSRLVYTSSPSVTFAGKDQNGVDENTPYPNRFLSNYPKTKADAEQIVLQENGDGLYTVALRPHLIWGPGDTQLIPRIIERHEEGKLRLVGDGTKKVDAVYVENAAQAHLLAADKLEPDAECAGKAYYISNDEPIAIGHLINRILEAANLPPLTKKISPTLAFAAGAILEAYYFVTRNREEPPMTRFVARQLATAHWYDISAAKKDLGYVPRVSMDEGMKRLAEYLQGAPSEHRAAS